MRIATTLFAVAFLLIGAVAVSACGEQTTAKAGKMIGQKMAPQMSKQEHASFTGQLVCAGCDLAKAEGARSECSVNGCQHTLRTEDGRYIGFLENKYSADLLASKKMHNQTISVEGTYFANANTLDVHSFEFDGQKKGWCGHCSKMDGCAYKDVSK